MTDLFVLKRIGKCYGGTNGTLNLNADLIRVGRHTRNDFCIDSTEWPCLISRFHSAVLKTVKDGITQFFIYDNNSLNGTFINNVKIPAGTDVLLKEGDIITFGCRGGNAVKEGGRATEEISEFQYMFCRNTSGSKTCNSTNISHINNHLNGLIKTENSPVVQSHVTSTFAEEKSELSSSNQLIKDHHKTAEALSHETASQSTPVQTQPLKNSLSNSTGHLTLPSEQITPKVGSQKRKPTGSSTSKLVTSSHMLKNGNSNNKRQKLSPDEGQLKAKPQKSKRNTKKNLSYNDDDMCSAFNCLKPSSEMLSWVQCDDCDDWFHVDCVSTMKGTYNMEQLEESEFHCGCV